MALFAVAVALLALRGGAREKRGAAVALVIGGGSIAIALAFAAAGQDYVLDRNLLPALIPLALIGAAGIAAPRSGRLGIAVGVGLVAYFLAFCVYSDFRPALQREDWRTVASAIGPPRRPRAILVWEQGDEPLAFYIGAGETRVMHRQWRQAPRAVSESRRGQRPPAARRRPQRPAAQLPPGEAEHPRSDDPDPLPRDPARSAWAGTGSSTTSPATPTMQCCSIARAAAERRARSPRPAALGCCRGRGQIPTAISQTMSPL